MRLNLIGFKGWSRLGPAGTARRVLHQENASKVLFKWVAIVARPVTSVALLLLLWVPQLLAASSATNQPPNRGPGFAYLHRQVAEVPWSIHIMKIDRSRTNLELHTTLGNGNTIGMAPVSEQAARMPSRIGKPIAAINGDFYRRNRGYPGDPEGIQIVDGEIVSAPVSDRICMWIDAAGNPHRTNVVSEFQVTWPNGSTSPLGLNEDRAYDDVVLFTSVIGPSTHTWGGVDLILERSGDGPWLPLRPGQTYTARVREVQSNGNARVTHDMLVLSIGRRLSPRPPTVGVGAILKISTATVPDLKGARTAIGGGPTLVRGGRPAGGYGFQMRHPRSAIGWNKDFFFMVEVDGRQRNLSVGMTLSELAEYMVELGCEEAINFDGGGSATLWVLGNVMNSPSEGWERPSANALVLVQKQR